MFANISNFLWGSFKKADDAAAPELESEFDKTRNAKPELCDLTAIESASSDDDADLDALSAEELKEKIKQNRKTAKVATKKLKKQEKSLREFEKYASEIESFTSKNISRFSTNDTLKTRHILKSHPVPKFSKSVTPHNLLYFFNLEMEMYFSEFGITDLDTRLSLLPGAFSDQKYEQQLLSLRRLLRLENFKELKKSGDFKEIYLAITSYLSPEEQDFDLPPRQNHETLTNYIEKWANIKLFSGDDEKTIGRDIISKIIKCPEILGVNKEIEVKLREKFFKNVKFRLNIKIDDILTFVEDIDIIHGIGRADAKPEPKAKNIFSVQNQPQYGGQDSRKQVTFSDEKNNQQPPPPSWFKQCSHCNKPYHDADNCWFLHPHLKPGYKQGNSRDTRNGGRRNGGQQRDQNPPRGYPAPNAQNSFSQIQNYQNVVGSNPPPQRNIFCLQMNTQFMKPVDDKRFFIRAEVPGFEQGSAEALADSGADCNAASLEWVTLNGLTDKINYDDVCNGYVADGSGHNSVGTLTVKLLLDNAVEKVITLNIFENLSHAIILGEPFMEPTGLMRGMETAWGEYVQNQRKN